MTSRKTLAASAALVLLAFTSVANALPRDRPGPATIMRDAAMGLALPTRVFETLHLNHNIALGSSYFFHGRYGMRSHERLGSSAALVEIDPYTEALQGTVQV